jgi:hypothetical protein
MPDDSRWPMPEAPKTLPKGLFITEELDYAKSVPTGDGLTSPILGIESSILRASALIGLNSAQLRANDMP